MKKQNVRTLVLIGSTLVYLLIGAAVFQALESPNEQGEYERLLDEELELRSRFNISPAEFQTITRNVVQSIPHKAGIQWKFTGSLYFVTTVITTIGGCFVNCADELTCVNTEVFTEEGIYPAT